MDKEYSKQKKDRYVKDKQVIGYLYFKRISWNISNDEMDKKIMLKD